MKRLFTRRASGELAVSPGGSVNTSMPDAKSRLFGNTASHEPGLPKPLTDSEILTNTGVFSRMFATSGVVRTPDTMSKVGCMISPPLVKDKLVTPCVGGFTPSIPVE